MSGKTIGLNMNHGFAGSYARQPNMVINTKPNVGSADIPFGAVCMQDTAGVKLSNASLTAANFVGIAARQIQTADSYTLQNEAGVYH